jgi:phosphoribosylglycinamide formyltransferase-1
MLKVKVAVLVSGGGTNLEALLKAEKEGKLPHAEIAVVVSSRPGVYALERAKNYGVKAETIERKECGSLSVFEDRLSAILEENGIEIIVLAGFLTVLSEKFVKKHEGKILNIHPSLLPAFGGDGCYGIKVHEQALRYGVKITGATVHFVNEVTDGGKIILQKAVRVLNGDTPESLQKRVMEQAEWVILPKAVELVCKNLGRK